MITLPPHLLFSLIALAVFYFIYISYRSFKKIQHLKKQIEQLSNDLEDNNKNINEDNLEIFLTQEKDLSKKKYKTLTKVPQFEFCFDDSIESQAALLRAYYLKSEHIALKWRDDKKKYWLAITKSLRQVFHNLGIDNQRVEFAKKDQIIRKLKKALEYEKAKELAPEIKQAELIEESLTNIEHISGSLDNVINCNNEKKDALSSSFKEQSYFSKNQPYQENINSLKTSVSVSNHELNDFKEKIKALVKEIDFLKGIKSETLDEDAEYNSELIYNQASKLDQQLSDSNLLSQVNLLRENNAEQRAFIVRLRNDIASLENEVSTQTDLTPDQIQNKLLEIEQLERMVSEFEHCIFSLESEVELLHQKIDELNSKPNKYSKDNTQTINNGVQQELTDLKVLFDNTMNMYNDQSTLIDLAVELAKHDKIIDLLIAINNAIESLNIKSAIYVRTEIANNKNIPSGMLSPQEENLLASKVEPNRGSQFLLDNKVFFWDKHLSIAITDLPKSIERKTQIIDTVALMKNIIVSEVKRVEVGLSNQRQQKTLHRLLHATEKEISAIDIQQNYQNNEYQNVINDLYKQLSQLKEHPSLPSDGKLLIKNIIEESKIRTKILQGTGSIVSTGFSSLISSLEKRLKVNEE